VINFSTQVAVSKIIKKVEALNADEFRAYVEANGTDDQKALLGSAKQIGKTRSTERASVQTTI
jgi:hypothetical protein